MIATITLFTHSIESLDKISWAIITKFKSIIIIIFEQLEYRRRRQSADCNEWALDKQ